MWYFSNLVEQMLNCRYELVGKSGRLKDFTAIVTNSNIADK